MALTPMGRPAPRNPGRAQNARSLTRPQAETLLDNGPLLQG
jgi:hypothetical protein